MYVRQVVAPHKSTDGMRKRMKPMNDDSCAFSVRKSLSTSVLTGTTTLHLTLISLGYLCFYPNLHTLFLPFLTDKFSCMQSGLVDPHACSRSAKGCSEDLKQHCPDALFSNNSRQYNMMPSHKHTGQSPALTAQNKTLPVFLFSSFLTYPVNSPLVGRSKVLTSVPISTVITFEHC